MAGFTVLLDRPTSLWASIVIVDALGTMIITRDTVVAQAGRRRGAQGRFLDKGRRGSAHTFLLSKLL